MKKLFAILTVLVMLCCSAAFAEATDVLGDWYLVELQGEGLSINPASMGMEITMTLNEDNTMTMVSAMGGEDAETQTGTWALTENGITMTQEDETTELTLVDGQLTMNMEGNGLVFAREPAEAEPLPAPVAAESEDAFFGTWKMSAINMMGMMLPVDALGGDESFLTVEAGKATITSGEETYEYATTFADGALTLTLEDETQVAQLNDDGSLSIVAAEMEELSIITYFEKAE